MVLHSAISYIIPVIIAFAKVVRGLGVSSKFIPIFNIILGIFMGIIYLNPDNIKIAVFNGIIAGLSASGLYSGVKNTIEGVRQMRKI